MNALDTAPPVGPEAVGPAAASQTAPEGRVCPPGLLAWQVCLLCHCAGIWAVQHAEPALWTAGALVLGLLAFRRPGAPRACALLLACALCFAAGRWRALDALPPAPALPAVLQAGDKAQVRARVEAVEDKPFGRIEILLADAVATVTPKPPKPSGDDEFDKPPPPDPEPVTVAVPGRIAWDWDEPGVRPAPGQTVEVELRPRPVHGFANAGGGDFEWRQRLRGVYLRAYTRGPEAPARFEGAGESRPWRWREDLRGRLLRLTPDTQGGAIVLGLLLGDRSKIGQQATDELRAAGLSHTLALSGLNVVYVAAVGLGLAWIAGLAWPGLYLRLPRKKLAVLLSLPLVAAYVWLGQASPSLVRSAWMFGFWGLLLLFDRGRVLLDGLLLALACILLLDPLALFDVGLQMSVAAVAGIALLYPWLSGLVPRPRGASWRERTLRALHWGWDALAMSLASNLALLPVTIWYFGTYPPNFLLNLPWLPVQGFAVQIPAMAGLALAAAPGLEAPAGWLLVAATHVQDAMLAALHAAMGTGWFPTWTLLRPLWPEILGASAALGAAPFCLARGRAGATAQALLLAGLALMAWPQAQTLLDDQSDEVRLTVLDVGQSQALVVRVPGGGRVLVDAGGSFSNTFDMGRSVVGPALTWGRPPVLDAALFSHPDMDHAQGLSWILRAFRVGRLYTNGAWPEGRLGAELDASLIEGANAGRLMPRALQAGDVLALGGGVTLEALHPAEDYAGRNANDASLVLRLVWRGEPLAILPGDVGREGIEAMLEQGRAARAQVLVLPHHGSKGSLSAMLYEAVSPRLAVVSCGFQNMYHFPNKDVVAELQRLGIPLSATPERGQMELRWTRPDAPFAFVAQRP